MLSIKAIFGYVIYALLASGVCLFVLFPEQSVNDYLNWRLAEIDSSLRLTAEAIRPSFPPGLKLSGANLHRDNILQAHFENILLSPELKSLMNSEKRMRFRADLAGGRADGRAIFNGLAPAELANIEASLSRVSLEQIGALQVDERYRLSGLLEGQIRYEGSRAGNGSLSVTAARIGLSTAFFGISELVIDQANIDFVVNRQTLRLKTLTFDGPMVEGKITGTIYLKSPVEQSRLNLSGNAKPRPEMFAQLQETIPKGLIDTRTLGTKGLNFRIRGTSANPEYSFR